MRTEQLTQGDADIAPIAALIGDPARARVLTALTDGRALPASRLAAEAGVAPSTVSEHLARLLAAGLVTMRPEGRSRFYRLASPAVAEALEAISRISPPQPIRSLRQGSYARALREARTCYNHLAGRLGVGLLDGLLGQGLLSGGDGRHHPERAGADRLSAPGRDLSYRLTPRRDGAG
jgi:DNA-binding transcriptional ArsR family regulator